MRFHYTKMSSQYNGGTFTDTRIKLEVLFYAEDQSSALHHLTAACSHLHLDFVPVEEQPAEKQALSKNKEE